MFFVSNTCGCEMCFPFRFQYCSRFEYRYHTVLYCTLFICTNNGLGMKIITIYLHQIRLDIDQNQLTQQKSYCIKFYNVIFYGLFFLSWPVVKLNCSCLYFVLLAGAQKGVGYLYVYSFIQSHYMCSFPSFQNYPILD